MEVILLIILEICGDGYNFGQHKCDDGNTLNGDGCSSKCEVEEGFECTIYEEIPDVCIDKKPPTAVLSMEAANELTITFSETVVILTNDEFLTTSMKVYLKNKCDLKWKLADAFGPKKSFNKLKIKINPQCSLEASEDDYIVIFTDPSLIVDKSNNKYKAETMELKTQRYTFISNDDEAYSKEIGSVFSSSSIVTLGITIGASLFQSIAMESFWSFMNMVQFISYLPGLNCALPPNFEIFMTDYLSIKKLSIPVDMIPEFPYNPLNYITCFLTNPFSERFSLLGYESISFIFNFLDELVTWLLLLLLYLLLMILCSIFSKNK